MHHDETEYQPIIDSLKLSHGSRLVKVCSFLPDQVSAFNLEQVADTIIF